MLTSISEKNCESKKRKFFFQTRSENEEGEKNGFLYILRVRTYMFKKSKGPKVKSMKRLTFVKKARKAFTNLRLVSGLNYRQTFR